MATNKMKRLITFVTALCVAFVALSAVITAFSPRQAVLAGGYVSKKLAGYKGYDAEYLLKGFGLEVLEGETSILGGRTVSYRLSEIKIDNVFDIVAENDENYSEATSIAVTSAKQTIKFLCKDAVYEFTVKEGETKKTYTVITSDSYDEVGVTYKNVAGYQAAVDNYAKGLKTNDYFKFSGIEKSISEFASAENFDIDTLRATVNYYVPGSTSPSTASGSTLSAVSFSLSEVGKYGFYITFTDKLGNSTSVDDLVLGNGGFYADSNDNGEYDVNEDTDLVVPIFTFTVGENSKPEVVVGASEDAYLDLEYEVECFNVTAKNSKSVYELYYLDQADAVNKADYSSEEAYIDAVTKSAKVKNVTSILDTEDLVFKPTENAELGTGKGYYYVLLSVYDENGYVEKVMSREIKCVEKYQEVVPERQFFKYNALSIVFLSISAVSFIAIIVLLFVRPKENKETEEK